MPVTMRVVSGAGGGRTVAATVCMDGQTTSTGPLDIGGELMGVEVIVPPGTTPDPQQVAALDGEPLSEYETELIRRVRRGAESEPPDWPDG